MDAGALALALAFAGCTLGHIFSPWLKFKGGKGIAVAAACLVFVFGPLGFLIEIAVFALGIAVTRCVSVGSIAAAVICPVLALLLLGPVGPLAHHRRHGLRRHLGPPRQHRPPARGHGEQDREQEDSLSINYG
ncbi:MAG: glycerol-3-phosphate acyltransferase [Adlercreutzia sp.]